jgi:hypothetical protein
MKVTIFRVQLSHLWNSEYCMFVSQSLAILLKFGPEGLHLKKALDRVLALMPEIAKIKAQELGNVISNRLADLNTERRTIIVSIGDQVKTFGRLSLPAMAAHVAVLNRFLDKHGRDIGSSNYNANTDRFTKLLADYDATPEVKAAATAMQLVFLFDHLRDINTQFATLYLQRDDENSSVEKVDAVAIRAEMDKALTALFDTFEIFSTEYEELDYQTPANKMNELISHYKTQLKARETRRHQGQDVHTEAPITAPA